LVRVWRSQFGFEQILDMLADDVLWRSHAGDRQRLIDGQVSP
jgi:hypothetical protein